MSLLNQIILTAIISAVCVGFITFVATSYWSKRSAREKKAEDISAGHDALIARVAELEAQTRLLTQSVVPISTAFQAMLVKELTHDRTPELDGLMVKIGPPYILTEEEEVRLFEMLLKTSMDMRPMVPETEREAARILPIVMKRAKEETRQADMMAKIPGIVDPVAATNPVLEKKAEEKKG